MVPYDTIDSCATTSVLSSGIGDVRCVGGESVIVTADVFACSPEVSVACSLCGVGGTESRIGVECMDTAPGEELMVKGDEACEFAMAGRECARSKTLESDEMKGSDNSDPYG